MSSTAAGALVGAAVCAAASPYLARLTLTVPERENQAWYRGRRPTPGRTALTAVIAAALGALGGGYAGWSALLPALVALALTGAPLVVIDFEHHRLPDRLVVPMALAATVLLALAGLVRNDGTDLLRAVEGAAAVFAVLFAVWFVAPRSFGYGDVKLGGILGGYLGWAGWLYVYFGIFAGFVLGTVLALALLATRRANLKTALAFGPMLILGSLIALAFHLVPNS